MIIILQDEEIKQQQNVDLVSVEHHYTYTTLDMTTPLASIFIYRVIEHTHTNSLTHSIYVFKKRNVQKSSI